MLALPFSSIHNCICGYYLGQKKTKIPAVSQLIEQLIRVGAVYVTYQIMVRNASPSSIWIAVLGIVIGESVSAMYCARYFASRPHLKPTLSIIYHNRHLSKDLLGMAIPLTSSRILMNLLQSIESISIPLCLQKYGYTNSEALSTYGVLTGMALPCILFPTALTNSVSTMLLPTVAEIQAEDDLLRLKGSSGVSSFLVLDWVLYVELRFYSSVHWQAGFFLAVHLQVILCEHWHGSARFYT